MPQRKLTYTLLFATWVGCNYFGTFDSHVGDFHEALRFSEKAPQPFTTFQSWFFVTISAFWDALVSAALAAVLAYHWRSQPMHRYISVGLLLRAAPMVFLLVPILATTPLSAITRHLLEWTSLQAVTILSLNIAFTLLGSYVGASYSRHADFLDDKDDSLGYLGGVSKKTWAVITLLFNPVTNLSCHITVSYLFTFIVNITSAESWQDMWDSEESILYLLSAPIIWISVSWGLAYGLCKCGIDAIRYDFEPWRVPKILMVFVAAPVAASALYVYLTM